MTISKEVKETTQARRYFYEQLGFVLDSNLSAIDYDSSLSEENEKDNIEYDKQRGQNY